MENTPLKTLYPVPKVFYPFPIHFLRIAAPDPSNKSISRILNSLQENNYMTIDDVVNTSPADLVKSRNFGEKGLLVLFILLETISQKPELVLKTEILEQPLRDQVERLKRITPIKNQFIELGIEI
jgi:hypothetical protein